MKEIVGDIWKLSKGNVIGITTNGIVKSNNLLTMGKGIAKEASNRFPNLAKDLGDMVKLFGNKPYLIYCNNDYKVLSFPTKNHWIHKSDIDLIESSAIHSIRVASHFNLIEIYLPRPGCGLGGLDWDDVKKVIGPILDNRFIIVTEA
jgi:O-acetyl-ADP-ribose deacetylase (regulator of RNase III)